MRRLWADFNELNGDMIWTSLAPEEEGGQSLRRDEIVELWDYEGNLCRGSVKEIDGPIIKLKVNRATWEAAPAGKKHLDERSASG